MNAELTSTTIERVDEMTDGEFRQIVVRKRWTLEDYRIITEERTFAVAALEKSVWEMFPVDPWDLKNFTEDQVQWSSEWSLTVEDSTGREFWDGGNLGTADSEEEAWTQVQEAAKEFAESKELEAWITD